MKTTVLQQDDAIKAQILKALIADFHSQKLFHPLDKKQLADLIHYFRRLRTKKPLPMTLDKSLWSVQFNVLVDVITEFLTDRPFDILRKTTFLYPWSTTSKALEQLVASTEFLVRSDPAPRVAPYTANGGTSSFSFCVSFPRSGSTLFTNILDQLVPQSRFSVFWSDGRYISRSARDVIAPGDVVVKDHLLCNEQLRNRTFYVVRDFRSVLRSHILYLFKHMSRMEWKDVFSSADTFIDYTREEYEFGDWQTHVSQALDAARTSANIKVVKYEDLASAGGSAVIADCLAFIGKSAALDRIEEARASSAKVLSSLSESHYDWRKIKSGELPLLVHYAQNSTSDDWYRELSARDRESIMAIVRSSPSAALGYSNR